MSYQVYTRLPGGYWHESGITYHNATELMAVVAHMRRWFPGIAVKWVRACHD